MSFLLFLISPLSDTRILIVQHNSHCKQLFTVGQGTTISLFQEGLI